jgi:hypothetical protein
LYFVCVYGILLLSRGEGMKKQGVKPSVADRCRNPAALEKNVKNPLTNSTGCAIIKVQGEGTATLKGRAHESQ